ncbi:WhiB family transcriptional regulator [Streptomyces sp. NPDC048521]|uniref:WhiB family transcriptional regulator n=1 Tax=Streptomyces sp. NPDC048521 TaxID=3365566 RepID=UPI00371C998A
MTATTRLGTTPAAPWNWRDFAACQGVDTETIFSEQSRDQEQVQKICRGCPVRIRCLTDGIAFEDSSYMVWGVVGGLTHLQRRALRVEVLLGNRPNLEQARKLASPAYARFMHEWKSWPAQTVAEELRRHGVIAAPVTVRVALWWIGAKGSLLRPKSPGDKRLMWEQVRDEHQETVSRLREMRLSLQDIAAFVGVSHWQIEQAQKEWNKAAKTVDGVKVA